ncbi:MAG TPA: stalk domain-containing protein, partial [bacterium]|nr:stalk domain-containing protein [bacterium]
MYRGQLQFGVLFLTGLLLFTLGSVPVVAAAVEPTLVVDGKPAVLASPLYWDQGSVLISVEDLATCLGASFRWNDDVTVWIQRYNCTILFRLDGAGEVRKNNEPLVLSVKARTIDGTFYLPLRFMAENLKATVHWNGSANRVEIVTGERQEPPERVSGQGFNAVVAYIDADQLWLLDGRDPKAKPKQITDSGKVELVGWSWDGRWLAYKCKADDEDEPAYLWVVASDGSQARQVDAAPVDDEVLWSPKAERLAYTARECDADGNISAVVVKWAEISAADIGIEALVEEGNATILSLAWHPDGDRIALSWPRAKEQPPIIEQVDLTGNRSLLHTFYDREPVDPELHTWAFISLNWSPDGKHLAYHLRKNSASLTADVVETRVLNIETGVELELSEGLRYPQWMA